MKPFNEKHLFDEIKSGKSSSVEKLYAQYRTEFLKWGSTHFDVNRHDLEDAWQETIIIFFEQVHSGKLISITSSLKSYLFAIGKHKLLNVVRRTKKIIFDVSFEEEVEDDFAFIHQQELEWENHRTEVHNTISTLSKKCRDQLIKRYYLKQSIEEIQRSENLGSPAIVSASISRCLKGLKNIILSKNKAKVI